MGTLERRERERLALRERILDAARELFVREGFEAVTMRKIAEKIDYSATALYKHFVDKSALLSALLESDFQALLDQFKTCEAIADPFARLMRQWDGYVAFALTHPDHYRLMFMTPKGQVDHPDCFTPENTYGYFVETVQACIAAGAFQPHLTDANAIAQTLWAALHGLVSLEMLRSSADDIPWLPFEKRLSDMRQALECGVFRGALEAKAGIAQRPLHGELEPGST